MESITLTILGSGTSTGVPVVGCACSVCTSSDPRDRRFRTSALISYQGKNILIDAGPDLRNQLLTHTPATIDAVLFTHGHADHILGIDELRPYYFRKGSAIPCFGTRETLEQIRRVFFYVFEKNPEYRGGGLVDLSLQEIAPHTTISVCGLPIEVFPLEHGNMPVVGFRFGDIAYATDCHQVPELSRQILRRSLKTLVLDGLRLEDHQTHMTIPRACNLARELGVPQTYLIHMSHAVGHAAIESTLPEGVLLAYDGLRITGTA
jgi:phosphoribosyl 1,2-cyclic phosphate phosphodiesterase